MAKLSIKRVENALLKHQGIILKAAEALGCTRPALYKFLKEHPELELVRDEARDRLLDVAESNMAKAIEGGEDMKTTLWYLERMGKNRGYSTRVEQTGADGAPVEYSEIRRTVIDPAAPPSGDQQEEDEDDEEDSGG